MAIAKKYTAQQVLDMLVQSEGRLSPVSNEPGHCMSLHIGQSGLQISDRLVASASSDASHPIIMGPGGTVVTEAQSRDIWRALNPGSTTATLKNAHRQMLDNAKNTSGAFLDQQQALQILRYVLNSSVGQAELTKLDTGAENRVSIRQSLTNFQAVSGAWKMNTASRASDQTHLSDFNNVFLLVDRIDADNAHIQTFYPIE